MTLLFLGKRTGSGPGPGRPPKLPNLNDDSSSANANSSSNSGLVDILNQLDSGKRNEMLSLVSQYKSRALPLNEFMMRSRDLLGERLYAQLARDMSNAAAARAGGVSGNIPNTSNIANNPMRMHSMPQIYSGIQAPNLPFLPPQHQQFPAQFPQAQAHPLHMPLNQAAQMMPNEIDVTKMDTSSLQDVMQYSGVDLKAEAELLYREHDNPMMAAGLGSLSVDHRLKFDYFFNPFKFRAIVQHALQRHFFSTTVTDTPQQSQQSQQTKVNKPLGISEDAVHLLGIAIQKRLIGILRKLSETSRHRVDYARGRFKIKIENDPKKQLWLQEKLFIEGVGEDRRKGTGGGSNGGNNSTSNTTTSTSANQTLLNPPSLATISAANKSTGSIASGKAAPAASTTSNTAAGGDDSVKTKLANVTAMAALGIRQKSWMSSATALTSSVGSSANSNTGTTGTTANNSTANSTTATAVNDEKDTAEVHHQHPLANFYSLPSSTPLTDSELRAQYFNRTIATVDLIACMEADPHLRRSKLLAVLYEALPRENKENASSSNGANASESN